MTFKLSPGLNEEKIFMVGCKDLTDRLDPNYYSPFYTKILDKISGVNGMVEMKKTSRIFGGQTPAKSAYTAAPTEHRLIKVSSYDGDFIDPSKIFYTQTPNTAIASEGDIYILSSAHQAEYVGRFVKYLGDKPEPNTGFVGELLCVRSTAIDSKYLFLILSTHIYQTLINREKRGQTSHIYGKDIGKIKIPVPPKSVQKKIVRKMDAAYRFKKDREDKAQKCLADIDGYLSGELGIQPPTQHENTVENRIFVRRLSDIIGSRLDPVYYQNHYMDIYHSLSTKKNVRCLGDLLKSLDSGNRPKGGVANILGGVLSLGGEHVNNQCEVEIKKAKYIPLEFHNSHKETEIKMGDLLLVKDGATTGKIGIVEEESHVGSNINEHLFLMRVKDNVSSHYLAYYLHSSLGKMLIRREITGATVTGVTRDIKKLKVIIAESLSKQKEIARHITQIRQKAKKLELEGKERLEQVKKEVETMILGDQQRMPELPTIPSG